MCVVQLIAKENIVYFIHNLKTVKKDEIYLYFYQMQK